jgi:hypothetical protein
MVQGCDIEFGEPPGGSFNLFQHRRLRGLGDVDVRKMLARDPKNEPHTVYVLFTREVPARYADADST